MEKESWHKLFDSLVVCGRQLCILRPRSHCTRDVQRLKRVKKQVLHHTEPASREEIRRLGCWIGQLVEEYGGYCEVKSPADQRWWTALELKKSLRYARWALRLALEEADLSTPKGDTLEWAYEQTEIPPI